MGLGRVCAWPCPRLTKEAPLSPICSLGEGRFLAGNHFPEHKQGETTFAVAPDRRAPGKVQDGGCPAEPHLCNQSSARRPPPKLQVTGPQGHTSSPCLLGPRDWEASHGGWLLGA